jgi:hypothetical protein
MATSINNSVGGQACIASMRSAPLQQVAAAIAFFDERIKKQKAAEAAFRSTETGRC